ncbi:MAG: hypothetical protein JXR55_09575 [Candidatus Fermentibacteraceae bacterium]|nr:hypothetical protein [Candidatus Fermentibacteraceae bacterium]
MTAVMAALLLLLEAQSLEVPLGLPVTIDYSIPQDLEPLPLETTADFTILDQTGDSVTIVPLSLDTLDLPPMRALSGSVELEFPPPLVTVSRTMPDTSWTVAVFTSPISMGIPPGFPEDYLEQHAFWKKWGSAPSRTWILLLGLALVLIAAGLFFWMKKRRKAADGGEAQSGEKAGISCLDEVLALLDSAAFAQGRWLEYYRDVDALLRSTVAFRFGVSNRALTWNQIARQLGSDRQGRKFIEDSRELTKEITLQRYAGWGGSRDRARRFTDILLSLRKEWHRK